MASGRHDAPFPVVAGPTDPALSIHCPATYAQFALKLADASRQGWLRNLARLSGLCEVTLTRDSKKIFDLMQFHRCRPTNYGIANGGRIGCISSVRMAGSKRTFPPVDTPPWPFPMVVSATTTSLQCRACARRPTDRGGPYRQRTITWRNAC